MATDTMNRCKSGVIREGYLGVCMLTFPAWLNVAQFCCSLQQLSIASLPHQEAVADTNLLALPTALTAARPLRPFTPQLHHWKEGREGRGGGRERRVSQEEL